jgi:hypothetical protein
MVKNLLGLVIDFPLHRYDNEIERQLVEHGDLLSELKRVQEGLLGGFECELTTPNTLLITGSGVKSLTGPVAAQVLVYL